MIDEDKVVELTQNPDRTISINAAWELVFRDMERDPRIFNEQGVKKRISWFLGFLEAKAGVHPPENWTALVEEARYSIGNVEPAAEKMRSVAYVHTTKNYYNNNPTIVVDRNDGSMSVTENGNSVTVQIPKPQGAYPLFTSALVEKEIAFIAFHDGFPLDYDFCCYQVGSNEPVWTSEVWSAIEIGFSSGSGGFHHVSFVSSSSEIWVFGVTRSGLYCQAHNLMSGSCNVRFYSGFFGRDQTDWLKLEIQALEDEIKQIDRLEAKEVYAPKSHWDRQRKVTNEKIAAYSEQLTRYQKKSRTEDHSETDSGDQGRNRDRSSKRK